MGRPGFCDPNRGYEGLGGKLVRTVGIVRARMKIAMQNLAYNLRRFVRLERTAQAA